MKVSTIQKRQSNLAMKAIADPYHKFQDLMSLIITPEWIEIALQAVLTNTGSKTAGVDGISKSDFRTVDGRRYSKRKITAYAKSISQDLKNGYKARPVLRVYIPKPNSKEQRPLGIPTIKDRTVQMLLKMTLEPIYEADFLNYSYGFRPGRRTWHIIGNLFRYIYNNYHYVIEGDIRRFFDSANHTILMQLLKKRIADKTLLAVVKTQLKSGIMEQGLFRESFLGTPQGGIVSPLLSNIYLHEMDKWWHKRWGNLTYNQKSYRRRKGLGNYLYFRYADD